MAIYKMLAVDSQKIITPLSRQKFADIGLRERQDIQASLVSHIEAISPNTLIIAEEFQLATWKDSNLRIDLLGIDNNADIVVIELKRTEEAGHAELQAIRYASLVATLTFEKVVDIYRGFLKQVDKYEADPEQGILGFLGWEEPNEEEFAQNTRIVLASADFSQELTTSVMWLNDSGLDIRCVRMQPYLDGENVLLDIQTIIPLPEASDYQVALREKRRSEQIARNSNRNPAKYDLTIQGECFEGLGARGIIRLLIKSARQYAEHVDAKAVAEIITDHHCFEGESLDISEIEDSIRNSERKSDPTRFFLEDEMILSSNGETYVFSNQWQKHDAVKIAEDFKNRFPNLGVEIRESPADRPGTERNLPNAGQ